MLELAVLLTIGYLGGRFRHVAWIFLSSGVVLVGAPVYLTKQLGIVSPLALVFLTLLAVATIQAGALTGLLKAQTRYDASASSSWWRRFRQYSSRVIGWAMAEPPNHRRSAASPAHGDLSTPPEGAGAGPLEPGLTVHQNGLDVVSRAPQPGSLDEPARKLP